MEHLELHTIEIGNRCFVEELDSVLKFLNRSEFANRSRDRVAAPALHVPPDMLVPQMLMLRILVPCMIPPPYAVTIILSFGPAGRNK